MRSQASIPASCFSFADASTSTEVVVEACVVMGGIDGFRLVLAFACCWHHVAVVGEVWGIVS